MHVHTVIFTVVLNVFDHAAQGIGFGGVVGIFVYEQIIHVFAAIDNLFLVRALLGRFGLLL